MIKLFVNLSFNVILDPTKWPKCPIITTPTNNHNHKKGIKGIEEL